MTNILSAVDSPDIFKEILIITSSCLTFGYETQFGLDGGECGDFS